MTLNSPHWSYLEHAALRTRYAVAASLLAESSLIIEVGGYKTPITQFLPNRPREVAVVDPLLEQDGAIRSDNGVRFTHHKTDFANFDITKYIGKQYDVLYLGLDMHSPDKSEVANIEVFSKFVYFCSNAHSVLVEYPLGWARARRQYESLVSILLPRFTFDCTMDLSATPVELEAADPTTRAGRLIRRIVQFDTPEAISPATITKLVARNLYGSSALLLAQRANCDRTIYPRALDWSTIRLHNQTELHFESPESPRFSTPSSPWGYAFDVQITPPQHVPTEELILEVSAKVYGSDLAVGIIAEDETEIRAECFLRDSDTKKHTVYLSIPSSWSNFRLIARTGSRVGPATVNGFSVELCHYKPRHASYTS